MCSRIVRLGARRALVAADVRLRGAFDLPRYCVVGVNVIGSCYGSTGPTSINPQTGEPYRASFPLVSIRDIVRAQKLLLDHLGVGRLCAAVGGSIGGMQALQWAVDFNERVERCIAIGATPLSAMGLALNHLQRQAIQNDPCGAAAVTIQTVSPSKASPLPAPSRCVPTNRASCSPRASPPPGPER